MSILDKAYQTVEGVSFSNRPYIRMGQIYKNKKGRKFRILKIVIPREVLQPANGPFSEPEPLHPDDVKIRVLYSKPKKMQWLTLNEIWYQSERVEE